MKERKIPSSRDFYITQKCRSLPARLINMAYGIYIYIYIGIIKCINLPFNIKSSLFFFFFPFFFFLASTKTLRTRAIRRKRTRNLLYSIFLKFDKTDTFRKLHIITLTCVSNLNIHHACQSPGYEYSLIFDAFTDLITTYWVT